MDYHQNARLTIHSRELLARRVVDHGLTLKLAAASFNVSAKTAAKWVRRFREAGARWFERSIFAPTPISAHHLVSSHRKGSCPAPAALQRLAHRPCARPQPGHCQPHPAPSGHEPAAFARSAAARGAL